MRGRIRYVFTSSHTCQGFRTFLPELLDNVGKVFVLKGAPGSGKSTFIRLLGESFSEQGYEVEFWVSAADPVSPEGVLVPQLNAAVVNGSLPCPIEPRYPGVTGDLIYLGDYWDKEAVAARGQVIIDLCDRQDAHRRQADAVLRNACTLKEGMRNQTGAYLNLEKLHQVVDQLVGEILETDPQEKHYFASAVTAEGMINYMDEISTSCTKRYVFRGPAGSGQSTVLAELARRALAKGYSLEYYHCGLETDHLQMIIVPNLQLALIDAGMLELAVKPWDIVVDMSQCLEGYDEVEAMTESSESRRMYEALMLEAQKELDKSQRCQRDLKKIYALAMDFEALDRRRMEVRSEIARNWE